MHNLGSGSDDECVICMNPIPLPRPLPLRRAPSGPAGPLQPDADPGSGWVDAGSTHLNQKTTFPEGPIDRPTDDRPTDRPTDQPTTDRLIDDSSGGLIVCLLLVCASLKECASRLLFNVLRQGKQPTDRPTDRSTDNRPTDRGVVVIVIASHFGSSISQA